MISTVLDGLKSVVENNGFTVATKSDTLKPGQAAINLAMISRDPLDNAVSYTADVEIICVMPIKPADRFNSLKENGEKIEALIGALYSIDNFKAYAVNQVFSNEKIESEGNLLIAEIFLTVKYRG